MSQFIIVNHSISPNLDTILVTIHSGPIQNPGSLKKLWESYNLMSPTSLAWLFPCYRSGLLVDSFHIPVRENVGKIKDGKTKDGILPFENQSSLFLTNDLPPTSLGNLP